MLEVNHKVYNIQAIAMLRELKQSLNSVICQIGLNIYIYLDNLAIIQNVEQMTNGSSQNIFK